MIYDLNSPVANFATYMKNYTNATLYGVSYTGKFFNLVPEMSMMSNQMSNNPGDNISGIYILTTVRMTEFTNMYLPTALDGRWAGAPFEQNPTFIPELGCVLFATEKERMDNVEKYGDPTKLIKGYNAGCLPLINSSYVSVTALNIDKEFYMMNGRNVVRLPNENKLDASEYNRRYGITPEMLDVYYIFIMSTICRGNGRSKQTKDSDVSWEMKKIDKSSIKPDEPIICANNGLVIFESKEDADNFIDTYGNVGNYFIDKGLEATHKIHEKEIRELNERASKDKKGMVSTFQVMGGTSVVSILTENVIKSQMSGDDSGETTKKALKIFGIGVGALLCVFGLYKVYRKWEDHKDKNESNIEK